MDPITKLAREGKLHQLLLIRDTLPKNSKLRPSINQAITAIVIKNMNVANKNTVLTKPTSAVQKGRFRIYNS